jgi:fructose transport system substrate-binding protein
MLDEHAGSSVGKLRHDGFLKGFGIKGNNKQITCSGTGRGRSPHRRRRWRTACRRAGHRRRTINEPSAAGAWTCAQERRQVEERRHDRLGRRGCAGVRNVRAGVIDATSQQYPLLMASKGVAAVVNYAKTGKKVSGYTDTGVNLIARKAVSGVTSKSVAYGLKNCWG